MGRSHSSELMQRFDDAGYNLGDVERVASDKYPAGKLEPISFKRHKQRNGIKGRTYKLMKAQVPPDKWPPLDDSRQVVKCGVEWRNYWQACGVRYWLKLMRPVDEIIRRYPGLQPELFASAHAMLEALPCDETLDHKDIPYFDVTKLREYA